MKFIVSRSGDASVRDQIAAQIEIRILTGELPVGKRLPSVRALARQLEVHPNTVSAAYAQLARNGEVAHESGSGVYVRRGTPPVHRQPGHLQELLVSALRVAFEQGLSAEEIRTALEQWMAARPRDRVLVVDTNPETAELLAHEIRPHLDVVVETAQLESVIAAPGVVGDALVVTWPFHLEKLAAHVPREALAVVTLQIAADTSRAIVEVPKDSIVLLVSHSPRVLEYGLRLITSLRGDELVVVVKDSLVSQTELWAGLLRNADLVFADALAIDAVRRVSGGRGREFRLVTDEALARMRQRLAFAVPRVGSGSSGLSRPGAGAQAGEPTARNSSTVR